MLSLVPPHRCPLPSALGNKDIWPRLLSRIKSITSSPHPHPPHHVPTSCTHHVGALLSFSHQEPSCCPFCCLGSYKIRYLRQILLPHSVHATFFISQDSACLVSSGPSFCFLEPEFSHARVLCASLSQPCIGRHVIYFQNMSSAVRSPGFEFHFCHLLAR